MIQLWLYPFSMEYTQQQGESFIIRFNYFLILRSRWLDSLIFNDEVEAYKSWTLFLIFVSILVLILGVVFLTHKKPDPIKSRKAPQVSRRRQKPRNHMGANGISGEEDHGLREEEDLPNEEEQALWALGEDSDEEDMGDDDDVDHHQNPINHRDELATMRTVVPKSASNRKMDEHTELVEPDLDFVDDDERDRRRETRINDRSRASSSRNFRPQR